MIRQISIRRGRAGTWDTLALIDQLGRAGASLIPGWARHSSLASWNGMLAGYWQYVEEDEETLRGVALQIDSLMRTGKLVGDCDDAAVVTVALANAVRFDYRIVAVRRPEDSDFSHVFVEVAGYRIDPTAPTDADYTHWERMSYPA